MASRRIVERRDIFYFNSAKYDVWLGHLFRIFFTVLIVFKLQQIQSHFNSVDIL